MRFCGSPPTVLETAAFAMRTQLVPPIAAASVALCRALSRLLVSEILSMSFAIYTQVYHAAERNPPCRNARAVSCLSESRGIPESASF